MHQRGRGAQEALLVGVENRNQRDLRQVEPLTQEVHTDQHVEIAFAKIAQQLHTIERVDVRMQVAHPDTELAVVGAQLLRHALGQRGHQDALALFRPHADLGQKVVDLAARRPHLDIGIGQAGGPDHLLHNDSARLAELVGAGRRRHVGRLPYQFLELLELQRPVVERRGQPEAMLHQVGLARAVAVEHAAKLGNGHVALVDENHVIVGQVLDERWRRLARGPPGEVAGVVLDTVAIPQGAHHLEVVHRPLMNALRLQQSALFLQRPQMFFQLHLDRLDRRDAALVRGHVVRPRVNRHALVHLDKIAEERIDLGEPNDLVVFQHDADGRVSIRREELDLIAMHPKGAALEHALLAPVVDLDQAAQQRLASHLLTLLEQQQHAVVGLGRAEPVNAGDRGDDDHVAALEQGPRCRVPQAVDLVVDQGFLRDIGVGCRQVGLGLVVVVVRNEELHRVAGEEVLELLVELRRQSLVVRDHQGRPLHDIDDLRHGEGLAGARDAEQHLVPLLRP